MTRADQKKSREYVKAWGEDSVEAVLTHTCVENGWTTAKDDEGLTPGTPEFETVFRDISIGSLETAAECFQDAAEMEELPRYSEAKALSLIEASVSDRLWLI